MTRRNAAPAGAWMQDGEVPRKATRSAWIKGAALALGLGASGPGDADVLWSEIDARVAAAASGSHAFESGIGINGLNESP